MLEGLKIYIFLLLYIVNSAVPSVSVFFNNCNLINKTEGVQIDFDSLEIINLKNTQDSIFNLPDSTILNTWKSDSNTCLGLRNYFYTIPIIERIIPSIKSIDELIEKLGRANEIDQFSYPPKSNGYDNCILNYSYYYERICFHDSLYFLDDICRLVVYVDTCKNIIITSQRACR